MTYTFKPKQKVYNFTLLNKETDSNIWNCKCSCGNTVDVDEADLLSGNKQSCGCKTIKIKRYNPFMTYFMKKTDEPMIIYPNTYFKDFLIIEKSENEGFWKCSCIHCDEILEIHEFDIINGVKIKCKCQKQNHTTEEDEEETPSENPGDENNSGEVPPENLEEEIIIPDNQEENLEQN